jgi:hypothetical protein
MFSVEDLAMGGFLPEQRAWVEKPPFSQFIAPR